MKRHLVTVAWLAGAILCYVAGSTSGMLAFVAAGLVCESFFWFRVLRRPRST
jgi:16S rRNA C1402 (ribose-2'-O) methylase RsmI